MNIRLPLFRSVLYSSLIHQPSPSMTSSVSRKNIKKIGVRSRWRTCFAKKMTATSPCRSFIYSQIKHTNKRERKDVKGHGSRWKWSVGSYHGRWQQEQALYDVNENARSAALEFALSSPQFLPRMIGPARQHDCEVQGKEIPPL